MNGEITSVEFETERDYDFLEFNGKVYSGKIDSDSDTAKDLKGLIGQILAQDTMLEWVSDYSVVKKGWKICTKQLPKGRQLSSSVPVRDDSSTHTIEVPPHMVSNSSATLLV
jgi:hypothetical protein